MNAHHRLVGFWEMYKLHASSLAILCRNLGILEGIVNGAEFKRMKPESPTYKRLSERISKVDLDGLREVLGHMELNVSVGFVDRVIRKREAPRAKLASVLQALEQVHDAIEIELSQNFVIGLTRTEAEYANPSTPLFGVEVEKKFPIASDEILESGKCYALGRSTASAFHSIRCLEAGIRAISRCLGIADPTRAADRSWFNMLSAINDVIRKKWPTTKDRLKGDGELFERLHGALAAIQNPYRNATMHFDQNYNLEQAKFIFEMSKGFMQKIASRMDEDGLPLA